jgi:hypothetical protein
MDNRPTQRAPNSRLGRAFYAVVKVLIDFFVLEKVPKGTVRYLNFFLLDPPWRACLPADTDLGDTNFTHGFVLVTLGQGDNVEAFVKIW